MKKLSFLLLLLMLCLPAFSARADAEGDFVYSVREGTAVITSYTGSADHLLVPDTLGGYPVTAISYCAFRNCASLCSVTLPDGILSIGSNAFRNCASLSQIVLPDSLTAIATHAFHGCSALQQIALPESIRQIHPYAFYGCSAVRLCSHNSRAALVLTDFGYSFTSPDYPQLSLKAYDHASGLRCFTVTDCSEAAESVSFPEGVTLIDGYAFFGCASLRAVSIPDSVTQIADAAFEGCASLQEVIIPESVVSIAENAFSRCPSLTIVAPSGSAAQASAMANGISWRAP